MEMKILSHCVIDSPTVLVECGESILSISISGNVWWGLFFQGLA